MKRTIEQALRDVDQEVALQLVAGHGDVRRLGLAGTDTGEEPLECVATDGHARGYLSSETRPRVTSPSSPREVLEAALVHMINPLGAVLYGARSPYPPRSRST